MMSKDWSGPLETINEYDQFVREYYSRACKFVRYRETQLSNEQVQDITQEAWASIFNRIGRIKNARAYLFTTLKSKIADEKRFQDRFEIVSTDELERISSTSTPEDIVILPDILNEKRAELFDVLRAVYELPSRQREAYQLRVTQRLSSLDIGNIIGCTPTAVDTAISRARTKLSITFGSQRVDGFEKAAGLSL